MGGLSFIVGDFPNWIVIRTLSYWMEDFFFIAVRLIRDNYKAVIENYSTSLIGGYSIRFIGYGLFGLFALSTFGKDELGSRFGPASGAEPSYWACLLVFF